MTSIKKLNEISALYGNTYAITCPKCNLVAIEGTKEELLASFSVHKNHCAEQTHEHLYAVRYVFGRGIPIIECLDKDCKAPLPEGAKYTIRKDRYWLEWAEVESDTPREGA